jgi:putative photosynthetic complex assembly protein 2
MYMATHGVPALLTALFLWWSGTGLILYLDGLDRRTHGRTLLLASLCAAAALYVTALTAGETSVGSAYHGFVAGLMVWAWQEVAFLLGYVTGPAPKACPPDLTGAGRARHAIAAILWHEIAILLGAAILLALCWGQPNQVALWTYLLLWIMRTSTKLNLFFGVRNTYSDFLPNHLNFLASYFRQRPMNLLFPLSVSIATAGAVLMLQKTVAATDGHEVAAAVLLTTLCALGLLEHWFLVLPLPVEQLWRWGLASHRRAVIPQPVPQVPGVQEAT